MVAKEADEGSGTIKSMSPAAVSEKRRLPDGMSQACRFSFCAVNRTVPDELKASRVKSAGNGIRMTRAFLATLQLSIKNQFGGLYVSKVLGRTSQVARMLS